MARHIRSVRGRFSGRTRELAARLAVPVLGLVVGVVVVVTSPDRNAPLWLVWAPVAVALSTAGGAVFSYGWRRWADLRALHPVRVFDVAGPTGILVVVSLVPNLALFLPGAAQANWRSALLVTFATLAAVPAASVAYGVRHAALSESLSPTKGGRLDMLIA